MELAEWKEVSRRASGALLQGRRKEARQLLEIALAFAERTRNVVVMGVSLNNLAVLASKDGKFEIAEELMARAYSLRLPSGEPSGLIHCLHNNAAVNLHRQGQLIEARPLYQQSVTEQLAPHRFADPWVVSLTNYAMLQLEQGKLTQAESLLKRARQSLEKLPVRDRNLESHLKFAMAQFALATGRLPRAETDLSELCASDSEDVVLLALAKVGLARVYHQQYQKVADLDAPEALSKTRWAGALLAEALGALLETKGAASLEYMEAGMAYVEHMCITSQWAEADTWVSRLHPWLERLGRGVHPWSFRLLELHARILRQLKRPEEADAVEQRMVDLRLQAREADG